MNLHGKGGGPPDHRDAQAAPPRPAPPIEAVNRDAWNPQRGAATTS